MKNGDLSPAEVARKEQSKKKRERQKARKQPLVAGMMVTSGSLSLAGTTSSFQSTQPLPALFEPDADEDATPAKDELRMAGRRKAVTLVEYAEHQLDGHAFDAAAAAAADAASTQSPASMSSSPTANAAAAKAAGRLAGRRKGLPETSSASQMFRAAAMDERQRELNRCAAFNLRLCYSYELCTAEAKFVHCLEIHSGILDHLSPLDLKSGPYVPC